MQRADTRMAGCEERTEHCADLRELWVRHTAARRKRPETFVRRKGTGADAHGDSQACWVWGGVRQGLFSFLSLWFDFHRIGFPAREGAPQVSGEEPQITPGLYSHNFLILPALDPHTGRLIV